MQTPNLKMWFLFLAVAGLLALGALAVAPAPVRADELPPRPTPAPTPMAVTSIGAYLTLHVENAPVSAWTVVQWQDGHGRWHDVTGWRGLLDDGDGNEKVWWVAPRDFDTGPFRWLVYDEPDGAVLGTSDSFTLPAARGATVTVEVTLPDP